MNRKEEMLRKALEFLLDTKWKSVDKDNMEFEGRVTCYQLEKARAALRASAAPEEGCICQEQHRRGYCTEPGCPFSSAQGKTP